MSNRSPAAAHAGSISAALPTSAMLCRSPAAAAARAQRQRLRRVGGQPVDVADVEPSARAHLVDLDGEADPVVHRHRQRLGAAHPAETGGQRHRPAQRPAEVLAGRLGERLVRALQDALRADVDPRPGGHLAVHRQALPLELAEDLPCRPLADEVRVGDQHARRPGMGAHDADRLARLDEQGLVVGEDAQLADDRVEGLPRACRATGPAVHDEMVRILRDLGIEVVHQHPQRRLLRPAAAGQLRAARGAHRPGARRAVSRGHGASPGSVRHRWPAGTRPTPRTRAWRRSSRRGRRRSPGRSRPR